MKQIWISRAGPPEVLEVREAADPEPVAGELRIRVEAAGVNFADVMARMGVYPDAPAIPFVVGYEVAGTVDAVGEGVDGAWIGKPVLALTHFGGYSDVVCIPAAQATERPDGMEARVGAAIPVTYLTAYVLLEQMGRVREGDRVLIHAAAGGVGVAALQLCKIRGAETFGTSSPGKHAFLREQGLDHPIDYTSRDFEREVMDLTDGDGVQLALDPIGGENWLRSYRCLAPTGRLMMYGVSSSAPGKRASLMARLRLVKDIPWLRFNPVNLMNHNKGVMGVNMGHLWGNISLLKVAMDQLLAWWEEGRVAPHVDRCVPFAEAPAAHHCLQDRENIGKVLLVP